MAGTPSSIEWAFPGPAPYTYMHVNPRDLGLESTDPYELGVQYVVQLNLWMQGIEAGKKIDVTRDAEPKGLDGTLTERGLHERNIAAQPMGPVPDERDFGSEEEAEKAIISSLGATVVSSDAPWNNEDLLPTAPKPWESGGSESPSQKASGSAGMPKKQTKTSIIDIDI